MLSVLELLKVSRMVRVIRDKAKFLKISKKLIEKEFVSMASMNCWIYEEDIGRMCSFLISRDGERSFWTSYFC